MEINELFDIINYGLTRYPGAKKCKKMNLLEYFSFTDIKPFDLSKIAFAEGNRILGVRLNEYGEKNYWAFAPLNMESRLRLFHSVEGYELTTEDKLAINDKLVMEGFPLVDGVFDMAARYFVYGGIDNISKEKIKNDVMNLYNPSKVSNNKTLVK